eukprot:TRINITY_DN2857_c0_g5_i4.p1 TRINITY_DN2857_c0_g5~~TRINITY_DN2857_c0_g5_i4.p1  ORF type:complete len:253 (-),score=55.36 TRINITY_DN2857_c0_g5_i4:76-834(-)
MGPLRRNFRESLKILEADVQHANTLSAEFPHAYGGGAMQMRVTYSPLAILFMFLVCWADCSLAGALGLMRILIYRVYGDGTTTMAVHERRASLREFYGTIYPSLQQLHDSLSPIEKEKQLRSCWENFKWKKASEGSGSRLMAMTAAEMERERECGICLVDRSPKVALPGCSHSLCLHCFNDWRKRSTSCPFCRDSFHRVSSSDLWVFLDTSEVEDMSAVQSHNIQRLFRYIEKLPLVVAESVISVYDERMSR